MFEKVGDREFAEFMAALWESRGWETAISEDGDGVYMVTGDKPNGTRGLMLVVPDDDAAVPGQLLQQVATLVNEKGIDTAVATTRGTFTDDARRIADANRVHLLGPESLEETILAEGLQDLVAEFANGSEGGGSLFDRLPVSISSLPTPSFSGGPKRLLVGVVTIVVLLALFHVLGVGAALGGVASGLPIPDLGIGLGGGGYTITAVSLADGNATPVEVRWDARTQETVLTPNGESYVAPEGETFVVVQLNVTNPRAESIVFRPSYLAVATDNTRYGPRLLQGAADQLPVVVEAEASASGYVVFSVPADSTSGTLVGLPGPDFPPMTFERDRSMAFQVSRE